MLLAGIFARSESKVLLHILEFGSLNIMNSSGVRHYLDALSVNLSK